MVEYFLGKKLSKFEQCSNWENRPLRKAQIHYAAMDAFIMVKIYEKTFMTDKYKGSFYNQDFQMNLNNLIYTDFIEGESAKLKETKDL